MQIKQSRLRRKAKPLTALLVQFIATSANASVNDVTNIYPHFFIGGSGEYVIPDDASDTLALRGYMGLQVSKSWSWDVGYQYINNPFDIKDMELGVFDTAIRYDTYFNNTTSLYLRGGIGYWMMDSHTNTLKSSNEKGFSPLGEVGLNYQATPHVYFNLGYKYLHDIGNRTTGEFNAHSVLAGVTYHFKRQRFDESVKAQATSQVKQQTASLQNDPPQQGKFVPSSEQSAELLKLVLQDVHFAFDSHQVVESDELKQQVNQTVAQLQQNPKVHIEVIGHTDSVGSEAYNLTLSKERADAVATLFTLRGVEEERITTTGKGAFEPIADNNTVSGRAQNRRVEIRKSSDEE